MMQIAVISASAKQPDWVRSGFDSYAKRLRGNCTLELTEIPLAKRGRNADLPRLTEQEGKRMLAATPKGAHVVALDESGRGFSTAELADQLRRWLEGGRPVALLIGGPDGLAADCFELAEQRWSLSALTLPHGLVRVIVAEALYRAWSVLEHHPYHRE
jgi:23S rRNA (pseudouridine1915-N3)-methyltransferase